jgi:nucleolin
MADTDPRKLFVAGLSEGATEVSLRQLFEAAGGNVTDVAVPRDRMTGRGRGFGFVTLASEQQATQLRDALDGTVLDGRSISVRAFRGAAERGGPMPGGGRPPLRSNRPEPNPDAGDERERTLFIANLPGDCTENDVSALIDRAGAGPIEKLHLPVDAQGRRRGFGFVTLKDATAARNAMTALRSATIRDKMITVDAARPKADRPPMSGGAPGGPDRGPWRGSRPPLPPRSHSDMMDRPPPRFSEPAAPPPVERQTWDDSRRGPAKQRGVKKETTKKKSNARAADRGRSRRESEGLRAPRAREFFDDWEDDDKDKPGGAAEGGDDEN